MPDTCHRCNNRLGLDMAIIEILTFEKGREKREICSACNSELQAWFATYQPKGV